MLVVSPTTSVMPPLSDESSAMADTVISLSVSELSSQPAPHIRAAAANRNMLIFFIVLILRVVFCAYHPGFCTRTLLRLISSSGIGKR